MLPVLRGYTNISIIWIQQSFETFIFSVDFLRHNTASFLPLYVISVSISCVIHVMTDEIKRLLLVIRSLLFYYQTRYSATKRQPDSHNGRTSFHRDTMRVNSASSETFFNYAVFPRVQKTDIISLCIQLGLSYSLSLGCRDNSSIGQSSCRVTKLVTKTSVSSKEHY